jgi:hypothetical protein
LLDSPKKNEPYGIIQESKTEESETKLFGCIPRKTNEIFEDIEIILQQAGTHHVTRTKIGRIQPRKLRKAFTGSQSAVN